MNLYHKLLSIPPGEHPPTYYQLLGLAPFESDSEVIVNAHRRQCRFVRTHALAFPDESQQLLNELTEAKVCLCDPERRRKYEQELRDRQEKQAAPKIVVEDQPLGQPTNGSSVLRRARLHDLEGSPTDDSLEAPSWEMPSSSAEQTHAAGGSEWVVGSGSGAQIRVRAPWVSRRHCRIRRIDDGVVIEDLGSTNGTYVNGRRVGKPTALQDRDTVTLGKKTRLPWPLPADCPGADLEIYSIGRSPDCDYVIDDKSVSSLHAQLIVEGETILLEDLNSTNGTRVGRLTNQIERCEIEPHLSLFFGVTKVFAQALIEAVKESRRRPEG